MVLASRILPVALAATLIGCAATTAPAPPPEERLLVVNSGEGTLSLIPVDPANPTRKVQLGPRGAGATDVSARGQIAVAVVPDSDLVVVVDLVADNIRRTITLPTGSRPTAVTIISDVVAYVANAGTDVVTRIDLTSGDTASVAVGVHPRDLVVTRGRLFVVNANLGPCPEGLCRLGESWLTVVDPQSNTRAAGRDSIPLPSPGTARSATLGGDGLIYVVNIGDEAADVPGRLSIVDPIARAEVGSFGGFGPVPSTVASDGVERLFVTSIRDGLMEFNTRSRRVVRGEGEGVFVSGNVAVAVDTQGRIYAIEVGGCAAGQPGRLRVFRPDLTEARNLLLGVCPVAAAFVQIPNPVAQ